ncbi:MAG: hypothetical protein P4M07_09950 [Xanthobacteraceae bacterium]|nr:hypothetical protein [Xanthobacteraceae bacterium]
MSERRPSARAVRAPLKLAAACLALFATLATAQAQTPGGGRCGDAADFAFLPAPLVPWKGAPLRVVLTAEQPFDAEFTLTAPDGSVAARSHERHGGPPYFWYAEVATPAAGTWHATLSRGGDCPPIARDIAVRDSEGPRPGATAGSVWPLRNAWNRGTENLYSAWIEKLFDAPFDDAPSWKALHEVLRDRNRNVLFDYLGLREDEIGQIVRPDCADLPYFLRAYFAFKMGLPFGFSKCTRGGGGQPPKCGPWLNIQTVDAVRAAPKPAEASPDQAADAQAAPAAPAPKLGLVGAFGKLLFAAGDSVHSGTARAPNADDNTDYYPVPLSEATLRPGATYVDPYGHVLVLSKRVAQTTDAPGLFFAVDAQPDGTVARKRYWRGNFLFVQDPSLGSPGFKRFRPIVAGANGALRRLTNAEIAKNPNYSDFSLEQSKLDMEAFYDKMDDVMSPTPLDPVRAMKDAIDSLEEQVKTRVVSVENGRKFMLTGRTAEMPDGPAIFETSGAWEDFATPARDLRLLIAIDVVRKFPERVVRRPERFAMPMGRSPADVERELQGVLASELAARKFAYTRTDGSPWTLALKDVIDRAPLLEMAYNVNDCVELRWGAEPKTDEAATCKRTAPEAQRARMTRFRPWFHDRRRPARGVG